MSETKPTTCRDGHALTWIGDYAYCDGADDARVEDGDRVHFHAKYYHWTLSAVGRMALCVALASERGLIARCVTLTRQRNQLRAAILSCRNPSHAK